MHRQCCSGKCMTYTYKCAPRVPQTLYDNKDSGADPSYFLNFWNPVYNPQRQEIEIVTLKNVDNVIGNSIQSTEKAGNVHDSSNPPIIGLTASCLPVGQPVSGFSTYYLTFPSFAYIYTYITILSVHRKQSMLQKTLSHLPPSVRYIRERSNTPNEYLYIDLYGMKLCV